MDNQEFFDELFKTRLFGSEIFEMIAFLSNVDFNDREICRYACGTMNCLYRLMDKFDTDLATLEERFHKEHKTLYPYQKTV